MIAKRIQMLAGSDLITTIDIPVYSLILAVVFFLTVVTVKAENEPVIDLNGPDATGVDFSTTFEEDGGPVSIVAADLTATAAGEFLYSALVTLDANPDQALEIIDITAKTDGTNIKKTYNIQKGILKLEGRDSPENYQSLLRSVTYENLSDAPETSDRHISFVINNGVAASEPAISIVAISAVNDAPILDNSGDMYLDAVLEDDHGQIGNDIASIIASAEGPGIDRIVDPDLFDPEGVAVIEVGDGNGTWEYSIDAGTSWSSFGTVSNSSAVLLKLAARVRFLPDSNYNGQASILFRAWDQTTEAMSGERADASINGGTSSFSIATESATVDVLVVNDPPAVDLNGALPGEEYAASFLSQGIAVALTAPDAFIGDLDSSEIISLTVTLTNRPDTIAESIVAGIEIAEIAVTDYDPVSGEIRFNGAAPLDDYSAVLRGLSYLNVAEAMSTDDRTFEFMASDGTDKSALRRTILASKLTNIAPVLDSAADMIFMDIPEDSIDPDGESVSEILATASSQPIHDDDKDDPQGFAIVGADNENGEWQFSVDNGLSWLPIGPVSESNALLLNEQAQLRFIPEANFSAETRNISVRAWDQSSGSNGVHGADTTNNGGVSAYSIDTVAIPLYIEPINDAPTLTINENTTAQFTEGQGPVVVAGPALQITDSDSTQLQSAIISITNLLINEPDLLAASGNSSGIVASYDDSTGTLRLTGESSVADYQALLRSITFDNLSQDPDTSDRSITFQADDGEDQSNIVSAIVIVEAMNDAPILDLNGEGAAGFNNTVYYDDDDNGISPALFLADALLIQDVDNTSLIGATVHLQARPDGLAETLNASTSGTNITLTQTANKGALQLSGQDSLAAYQQVLRSVTYSNGLPFASRDIRKVSFTIQDADSGSSEAEASVVIRPQFAFFPIINIKDSGSPVSEEPNDNCGEAFPIANNVAYQFDADDKNDWFSFSLLTTSATTVELSEFAPEEGQLLVAEGTCGSLKLIGHNGDFTADKVINLGSLDKGRYYIWLINDGATDLDIPYKLRVITD